MNWALPRPASTSDVVVRPKSSGNTWLGLMQPSLAEPSGPIQIDSVHAPVRAHLRTSALSLLFHFGNQTFLCLRGQCIERQDQPGEPVIAGK